VGNRLDRCRDSGGAAETNCAWVRQGAWRRRVEGKVIGLEKIGGIPMLMIRSVVRPEKVDAVLAALMDAGFPAVTKMSVVGRGKQRGLKIGEVTYDEIPKELLLTVVKDQDKDFVIKTVLKAARTGEKGAFGDGKIFVSPVEEVYTISSGIKESGAGELEEVKP
jgi:nitrogen regulatory protein PII 1